MSEQEAVKKILKANGCLAPCDCSECQETANHIARQLCKVMKWGEAKCEQGGHEGYEYKGRLPRIDCSQCMQQLRTEAGMEE